MAKLTGVEVFWRGPGWYVREVDYDRTPDTERHAYRFVAPLTTSVTEMQELIKRYEKPPDYITPVVRRWRTRPVEDDKTTVHDETP